MICSSLTTVRVLHGQASSRSHRSRFERHAHAAILPARRAHRAIASKPHASSTLAALVTYTYRLKGLLAVLRTKAPTMADVLVDNCRHVNHGLLSVGIKIHCLDNGQNFHKLIEGLGGALQILAVNYYKNARASL